MKRKGISPLIAAVLLIAFTMAVASLFAQWAPQLVEEAQGETRNQSGEIQRCSGIIVDVIQGNKSYATIQQTAGGDSVGNMSVTWFYESNTPKQKYAFIGTTRGTDSVNVTGESGVGTLDNIQVQPLGCQGAPTETYSP